MCIEKILEETVHYRCENTNNTYFLILNNTLGMVSVEWWYGMLILNY
uniref:Uncharacterized protein n=1 Tax=Anguilla anguilla TaxID=7936 RepID=A0A0E9PYR2_ANGAN